MAIMNALAIALKEWAVICAALAEGRQIVVLRKGGIAEPDGQFRVEHERFWLYPTYVHQQESGIVAEYQTYLEHARASQPAPGRVRLSHFADVVRVDRCTTLEQAEALAGWHGWSASTVASRFHYREPGLYVLTVRVYRVAEPVEMAVTAHFEGCKSWVDLGAGETIQPFEPVLSDAIFTARCRPLEALFNEPRSPRG